VPQRDVFGIFLHRQAGVFLQLTRMDWCPSDAQIFRAGANPALVSGEEVSDPGRVLHFTDMNDHIGAFVRPPGIIGEAKFRQNRRVQFGKLRHDRRYVSPPEP
jgi:hypothetical protein